MMWCRHGSLDVSLSGLQAGGGDGGRGFCNPAMNAAGPVPHDDIASSSSQQLKHVRRSASSDHNQRRAAFNPYDLITDTGAPDTQPIMATDAAAAAADDDDGGYLKPFTECYWRLDDCTVDYANDQRASF